MAGESWVRLWAGMTTDPKFRTVARKSGRPVTEVICLFCHLMLVANDSDLQRGCLDGLVVEDVASALDMAEEDVEAILSAMEGRLIAEGRLSGWDKRQPVREDVGNEETGAKSSTQRSREFREKQKSQRDATQSNAAQRDATQSNAAQRDATQSNAPEAESDTEADTEKPREIARAISDSTVVSPGDENKPAQSPVARVCLGLKAMGYGDTNPHDPKLAALLDAGMTPDELLSAGEYGRGKSKGFRWVLATAEGRRRDAENVKPLPAKAAAGSLSKAGQRTAEAAARWLESQGVQP